MKVVINSRHGGFSLSAEAEANYRAIAGIESDEDWWCGSIPRDDPRLVQIVSEMGAAADGAHATLKIVEIPDDVEWTVMEYDGLEWIAEVHRTWS